MNGSGFKDWMPDGYDPQQIDGAIFGTDRSAETRFDRPLPRASLLTRCIVFARLAPMLLRDAWRML